MPYLDADQARRVYDRIGRLQDTQRVYEGRAVAALVAAGRFDQARAVVEAGCGTGALAVRLLRQELPADARYVGVDLSPRMAAIARRRLARFGGRAEVQLADAAGQLPVEDGWADRVVSAYVLDLLPPERAAAVVAEAARVLLPGGLLCLVSLTRGRGALGRLVSAVWERLWQLRPQLVGGCRPGDLLPLLGGEEWQVEAASVVTTLTISSQFVVARRTG